MGKLINFPVERTRPPELSPEMERLGEMLFQRFKGREPSGAADKLEAHGIALRVWSRMVKIAQERK